LKYLPQNKHFDRPPVDDEFTDHAIQFSLAAELMMGSYIGEWVEVNPFVTDSEN